MEDQTKHVAPPKESWPSLILRWVDRTWMAVLIAYIVYVNWFDSVPQPIFDHLIMILVGLIPVVLLGKRTRFAIFALPFISAVCCQMSYSLCDINNDKLGVLHFAHEHVFPVFMFYSLLRLILVLFAEPIWKQNPRV